MIEELKVEELRDRSEDCYASLAPLPADASVTMAYVPFQTQTARYDDEEALLRGTLYPALNKPFLRGGLK